MAAPSISGTVQTTNSAHEEIQDIGNGLRRMDNEALSKQRVVLSEDKAAFLNTLALGAKLERALDHRMTNQDAQMRRPKSRKPISNKVENEKVEVESH